MTPPSPMLNMTIKADTRKLQLQLARLELSLGAGPIKTLMLRWRIWRIARENAP